MAKATKSTKNIQNSKSSKKKVVRKSGKKRQKTSTTKKTKGTKNVYKRGDLGRAIYAYLDEVGLESSDYETSLQIALKVLPTSKYSKAHWSWYKNKYRELRDLA
jgi:hypothetical protein